MRASNLVRPAAALLLLFTCPVLAPAEDVSVERALKLLDRAVEPIKSFDVNLEFTRRWFIVTEGASRVSPQGRKEFVERGRRKLVGGEEPKTARHFFRQCFQGGKVRIEDLDGPVGKPTGYAVYDGVVMKTYVPGQALALVRDPSVHYTSAGEGASYFEAYRNIHGIVSLRNVFHERKGVVIKDSPPGDPLLTLEVGPDPKSDNLPRDGFRVTLDSRRGYLPARFEYVEYIDKKPFVRIRRTVEEWQQVGSVWVPLRALTRVYDKSTKHGTFGELFSEGVLVVNVAASSWNKELPERTFTLPIPAGTRVTDFNRKLMYVTERPDPGTDLGAMPSGASGVIPVVTHSREPFPPRSPRPYLVAVGLVLPLIAGGLCWLYLRRRKPKGLA